jgi:hypothetical protein
VKYAPLDTENKMEGAIVFRQIAKFLQTLIQDATHVDRRMFVLLA